METEDYIDFADLRRFINIEDKNLLITYLKEVFKDLSDRCESNKKKGITKITFLEYMKLPVFIAEKLFLSFDSDGDGYLSLQDFVDHLTNLYLGDFNETIKIIFNIFDFNKDGIITKGDVKVLLSYLPLKVEKNRVEYKFQMDSLEEIEQIVKMTFAKTDKLRFEEFKKITETKKSDVYLQLLCFLYFSKPFSDNNINVLKSYKKRSSEIKLIGSPPISPPKNLPSPNRKSILSPVDQIFKLNLLENEEEECEQAEEEVEVEVEEENYKINLIKNNKYKNFKNVIQINEYNEGNELNDQSRKNEIEITNLLKRSIIQHAHENSNKNNFPTIKNKIEFSELADGHVDMIRMANQKITIQQSDDLDSNIKYSKNVFKSPSTLLKRREQTKSKESVSEFSLEDTLIKMQNMDLTVSPNKRGSTNSQSNQSTQSTQNNVNNSNSSDDNSFTSASYENWVYKLSENQKIKKYWLVLSGKDIYYYRTEKKEELMGMHNLSGAFVRFKGEKRVCYQNLFSFTIQFSSKERQYLTYTEQDCESWVQKLKESIGYKSFFDFYEMQREIGQGKFGVVKLGIHKKTKEKVAIKIMKKESMEPSDIELVKYEIDIMKLCRHPNIVSLLDHFENSEYIFIIMELLCGGDLETHFRKQNFRFKETKASNIMFQLASGIEYLHGYGVVHRDLKPENIMLADKNEDYPTVKIMDFGLSKIMGPLERTADGFGTLAFVAPEVLVREPYNKQIDIWSLGVILYYMLSGTLPFDDENDDEEKIAKRTVFSEVMFPDEIWEKRSDEVVDLISKCLIKDPEERIEIDEFLRHMWIRRFNK